MTMNKHLSNLYYTFGIMGLTHDEINIIVNNLFKTDSIDFSRKEYLRD